MKKRMMLIINPMAGRSGYKTGFGEVMNILDSGGYLTTVYFTQGRGDATVMAAQHAAEYDTVACIGGDGTLSEVVSGLMQVPNPPPLGYIPMGTTNDVASTLGLPKNATDAALRIVTGTPTAFDVGSRKIFAHHDPGNGYRAGEQYLIGSCFAVLGDKLHGEQRDKHGENDYHPDKVFADAVRALFEQSALSEGKPGNDKEHTAVNIPDSSEKIGFQLAHIYCKHLIPSLFPWFLLLFPCRQGG